MKPVDLSAKHIEKIFEIYAKTCAAGSENWLDRWNDRQSMAKMILHDIAERLADATAWRHLEYRVGSRWDGHSKMYFRWDNPERDLHVHFYANLHSDERDSQWGRDVAAVGREFDDLVAAYLAGQKP